MSNLRKNFTKRLLVMVTLLTSVLVMMSTVASATETESQDSSGIVGYTISGEETWYDRDSSNVFTVTDSNLSYTKTIGKTGILEVKMGFRARPDLDGEHAYKCPRIKVTMQIRSESGQILASGSAEEGDILQVIPLKISVTKGQKIRIFTDVSSVTYNPYRNFRSADIQYSYIIQ